MYIVDKLKAKMFISVNIIYTEKMIIDFPARLISFEVLKDFVTDIQIRAHDNQPIRRIIRNLENAIILPYFIREFPVRTSKYQ
jgi:hypothetical protein